MISAPGVNKYVNAGFESTLLRFSVKQYTAFVIVKRQKDKSGCGTVGRAVASKSRGPGFESSHRQLLLNIYLLLTDCRKDETKEKKRSGMAHF